MPGPWRLMPEAFKQIWNFNYNLRRDARPLATRLCGWLHRDFCDFNLRRDARPLATSNDPSTWRTVEQFQSQTRCQAPGDLSSLSFSWARVSISISDEMPGPWRQDKPPMMEETIIDFNLRRDARPLATLNGPG